MNRNVKNDLGRWPNHPQLQAGHFPEMGLHLGDGNYDKYVSNKMAMLAIDFLNQASHSNPFVFGKTVDLIDSMTHARLALNVTEFIKPSCRRKYFAYPTTFFQYDSILSSLSNKSQKFCPTR